MMYGGFQTVLRCIYLYSVCAPRLIKGKAVLYTVEDIKKLTFCNDRFMAPFIANYGCNRFKNRVNK